MDVSRRAFLRGGRNLSALRPPWLKNPATFTDACTRCGDCIARCDEGVLVAGDGGYPQLDFSWGECTFCGRCTEQCEQSLFDADRRSLPWTYHAFLSEACLPLSGVMCRSCEDACEPRAIRFPLAVGRVPAPAIDTDACTGCGACVAPCPVQAISLA